MGERIELCCECGQPTGRAGRLDDSLYFYDENDEESDGEHDTYASGGMVLCQDCESSWFSEPSRICSTGPDYREDTDVLLRMLRTLASVWTMGQDQAGSTYTEVEFFAKEGGECLISGGNSIQAVLLAAVLAGIAELEVAGLP